ncbi:hypothetical protein A0256_17115 [Mucilaginibacter sp. PAMC 26640]|nr:hypothetical protein A0256_17115 [Mucilaginibacter sp. PAMC 26640]
MGKIFTIAEGLQNMGALRTGGQGSVYKAKRTGDILVAVKLLPTPVITETDDDKNYSDFKNEVEKLKKVNEKPNPNVVKILNFGITESGSFPFIEMEFIEGPDLAELLKPPHDAVFTIPELIKVADQLANALNHCHKVSVKHGDIKSNNVKYNANTGNYVLLDFGLAIMSDEQRRDSLRNAGAVEFMAPEQNEGSMLPQSDVYSYGIVLYELLAGVVPFPLNDNGQTARNHVMLAHMDSQPPDPLKLRDQNMPASWSKEIHEREMQVPEWFLNLVDKCLKKDPRERFANGMELRDTILMQHSVLAVKNKDERALILQNENERLQTALLQERAKTKSQLQQLLQLKETLTQRNQQLSSITADNNKIPQISHLKKGISNGAIIGIALLTLGLGGVAGRYLITGETAVGAIKRKDTVSAINSTKAEQNKNEVPVKIKHKDTARPKVIVAKKNKKDSLKPKVISTTVKKPEQVTQPADTAVPTIKGGDVGKIFTVFSTQANFHTEPTAASVRRAYINRFNNVRLKALDDKNGYIYVIFTNDRGQVSTGWLDKKDLIVVGQ